MKELRVGGSPRRIAFTSFPAANVVGHSTPTVRLGERPSLGLHRFEPVAEPLEDGEHGVGAGAVVELAGIFELIE